MKLNWLGRASMNNAARAWGQAYAASWLERLGGRIEGGRVLEVGCGRGVGVQIIYERFGASLVEAIDLDPKMIECAHRRLVGCGLPEASLSVGDVTCLKSADASFDAVFDFGAIHLEPEWPKAIAEIRRVLKPGGRFFFEWVTSSLLRLPYPLVTERFVRMDAPRSEQMLHELERQGIRVGPSFVRPKLAALSGLVGDLVGVGWAANPPTD